MKRIVRSIAVRCPADVAWTVLRDIDGYDQFMVGITRWERVPERADHVLVLMQVGSIAAGGEVRIDIDDQRRRVSWSTVRGTEHTAAFGIVGESDGRCRILLQFTFRLTGPAAPVTELLAVGIVRRNLVATLETVRHLLEHELES